MQFRDAAPTVNAAPSARGSFLKLLVPAGAGFAVGGPIGAAVGLGAGFLLGRGSSPRAPTETVEARDVTPRVVDPHTLTEEEQARLAALAARANVDLPAALMTKETLALLEKAGAAGIAALSEGGLSGGLAAAGAYLNAAIPVAVPLAVTALIAVIILEHWSDFVGSSWDRWTPAQKAAYTDCVAKAAAGGPACQFDLSQIPGQGTGSKQLLINGEYVTIGRTAVGQAAGATAAALTADSGDTGHWIWNSTYNRWQCKRTRNPVTGLLSPCGEMPVMDPNTAAARGVSVFGDYGDTTFEDYDYFGDVTYVVQPGESLTEIALAHGLCTAGTRTHPDWSDCLAAANRIAQANGITDPDLIVAGQSLIIPDVTAKVVQTDAGPVVVPVPKKSMALPMIIGLGVLGAFLMLGRH